MISSSTSAARRPEAHRFAPLLRALRIRALGPFSLGPVALGAFALGAVALGPVALGAFALSACAGASSSTSSSAPGSCSSPWAGTCELKSVTKVAERELPIQLVEYEALYEPVNSPSTVPAGRVRAQVRSHDEVSLQEHYQAHHHTRCEQTFDAQCRPGPLLVHVPELAPRPDVAPAPERTCASLLEGAESSLPAGESTLPEELSFPEDSTTPDAASAPALEQIAARLRAEPTIECLAVVAQATPNERPGIAELRAAAIRRQLIERGIAPSRLHAVALTTNVLGPGRPDERPPSERRVRFRVLLQQGR